MKKLCIIFLTFVILSVTALGIVGCFPQSTLLESEYLRIHIRADSNEESAQAVKYVVKEEIVTLLTPIIADCEDKESAVKAIQGSIKSIEKRAEETLKKAGFSYGVTACVKKETFPTRKYGEYTLPAGEYTALIIRLGKGAGDNWWCVVYPPLCFSDCKGQNIRYKSKIAEIIRKWVG